MSSESTARGSGSSATVGGPPTVSVVVPVRNRRDLLAECMNGLARQTYRELEVIVVDDGSTDGSADVASAAVAAGLPGRVVVIEGRGAVRARLAGIAEASGAILAFTDSDCVPHPGWLAGLVEAVEAGADVVQGRTEPARPPGRDERTMIVTEPDPRFPTCNVAYRRSAYEKAGGFDPGLGRRLGFRPGSPIDRLGFGEDTDLAWRVIRPGGRHVFVADAVVEHAVFPFDRSESLRRAWMSWAFPVLLREVPEIRSVLRWGLVYGAIDKLPAYGAVPALLAGRRRVAAGLAAAWVALSSRRLLKQGASVRELPGRLPNALVTDVIGLVGLMGGCVRARRLVL